MMKSMSGNTAYGKVEWQARVSSKRDGSGHESKTLLEVTFKKEDDGWKIKEIKP
jgi:ketosteroid isomerase-like protein